jgi:ADP-ribose pyrophosphatase YjhB (NUDIX family)
MTSEINWRNKCFVSTGFIVQDNKVLLTYNRNVNLWVPVGGHMEPGETPDESLLREIKEETGLKVEFLDKEEHFEIVKKIHQPYHIQVEKVPHHEHHINFVYFLKSKDSLNSDVNDRGESLKWFAKEDLASLDPSVKLLAAKAIRTVNGFSE